MLKPVEMYTVICDRCGAAHCQFRRRTEPDLIDIAQKFHDIYERLAPQFGYATRTDTRKFDPHSPNGKLMIATIHEILNKDGRNIQEMEYSKEMERRARTFIDDKYTSFRAKYDGTYQFRRDELIVGLMEFAEGEITEYLSERSETESAYHLCEGCNHACPCGKTAMTCELCPTCREGNGKGYDELKRISRVKGIMLRKALLWRRRCEELEVVAAALYLGHDDAKEQMDMYKAVYLGGTEK